MRILVTGAGGPSAISVWKSLASKHELIMADIDPCACGLYLVPPKQRLIVPRGDTAQFVPFLLSECRRRAVQLLIPTVDAELLPLSQACELFRENQIQMLICEADVLQLCRDKHALLQYCKGKMPVPESVLLNATTADQAYSFPRFVKPRQGAGSNGVKVVHNRDELLAVPLDDNWLLQELLPGAEYSVDVYVRGDGVVIAAVPRVRMKTDSGIAVTARTVRHTDAIDAAIDVARHVRVRYVANIQFKRDAGGVLKLLEINPRFAGTLPLTRAAGIDLPALLVQEAKGLPLPANLLPFSELMVVRYWTEHFFDAAEWEQLCVPAHG